MWPCSPDSYSSRSLAVISRVATRSAGGSGGNVPWVREYAIDQASGISSRRASGSLPATATVPETTTYGSSAQAEGRNSAR